MIDVKDKCHDHQAPFFALMQQVGTGMLDIDRTNRKGFPEVILAEGKEIADIIQLLHAMSKMGIAIASRVNKTQAKQLKVAFTDGLWKQKARVFIANPKAQAQYFFDTKIAVVTAGLSDASVAEEAACILHYASYPVETVYDIGISALQRLLAHLGVLKACDVIIVAAGMDGALPAVIAGLVAQPVIALPTSIGYGVAQHGMAALNTMLASCAPGMAVVNIDNGYGAAMMAHAICMRIHKGKKHAQ